MASAILMADGQPRGARALAAFQAQLAQRLAQAAREPAEPGWMALQWRGVRVWLPLADAGELVPARPLRPLPHAQAWVLGVAAIRAAPVAVVDWVAALGVPDAGAEAAGEPTHWLALNPTATGLPLALCVDRLPQLRASGPWERVAASPPWRWAWRDAQGGAQPVLDAALLRERLAAGGLHQPAWAPQRRVEHA